VILVTGATGCLGSNLTRELVLQGHRVAVLRRLEDPPDGLGAAAGEVEHRIGDVRDPDSLRRAMAGVDRVYHLAGVTVLSNRLTQEMQAVNVDGARNVARAARAVGARMVHTSSTAAIGWPDGIPADEHFSFNGSRFRQSYMTTKWRGEQAVLDCVRNGLNAVVVNPGGVLAPHGSLRHGWAALVQTIIRGRLLAYPSGGLGFVAGRDAIDGHIKAMERGQPGRRYIINTRNLSYQALCRLIADVVGAPEPVVRVPGPVIHAAGWCGSAWRVLGPRRSRAPLLARENIPMLTRALYYDQTRAVRELGLSQTSLGDAIREVRDWCLTQSASDERERRNRG
jgi:dihydroflavonol-4-reductase